MRNKRFFSAKKLEDPSTRRLKSFFPKIKSSNIIFFVLFIYLLAAVLIFSSFNSIVAKFNNNKPIIISEGILQPKAQIPVSEIFSSDPLLTSRGDSDSLFELRKNVSFLIYSSLFKETSDGKVVGDLVEKYDFNEAKELKIKIRSNVLWHDGEQLTSSDVIFTLKQLIALAQDNAYFGGVNAGDITYTIQNNTEFTIKLEDKDGPRPNAAYLHELTFPILPEHLLSQYSQSDMRDLNQTKFGKNPIGSGKLIYKKNKGGELELAKNEKYYGEKVNFDIYKIKIFQDLDEIKKEFALRNIDIYATNDTSELGELEEIREKSFAKYFNTILKDRRFVLYFNLNPTKNTSPFATSFTLRNATQKIINRQNISKAINNYGREIFGPIDQDSSAFLNEMREAQKTDISSARSDIEGAGYALKNGFYEKDGKVLNLKISYLSGGVRDDIAKAIENDLKKAGIKVELRSIGDDQEGLNLENINSSNEFNNIVNNRTFEALLTIVSQYQDPDRYSEWHSSRMNPPGLNLSSFSSVRSDFALSQGRLEFEDAKRVELYKNFQNDYLQEVPAIYLLNPEFITFYSDRISDIEQDIITNVQYKYSNISKWRVGAD